MEKNIELRYAGVVIGRVARIGDVDAQGLLIGVSDPMPVGTAVTFTVDGEAVEGRVEQVTESSEPARCGMRVRFDDPSAVSLFGISGGPARAPRPVVAAAAPAPAPLPAASAPVVVATPEPVVASAAPPAATDEGDGASGAETAPDSSASEGDHGAAPDSAANMDDSGGQPGVGGGRRRRRRR